MTDLFTRGKPPSTQGFPIGALLRRKETSGSVGIEIEVEGNKFPKPPGMAGSHKAVAMPDWKFWSYVKDGSLRGQDNAEYVLTSPIEFYQVGAAIKEVSDNLKAYGSVLDDSNRASVHVHLNCQKFHMNRLASFAALWFCFEEVLTEWCGDHRVGNLFCLRAKDAPGIITRLRKFISSDGQHELSESLHYSGFNSQALNKFGSIEIRTLRGPTDFAVIEDWVGILERLYVLSGDFADPRDIPSLFSQQGPLAFFETVLGDKASVVRAGIEYDDNRIKDSMYEGIRMAQDICYCRDWSLFAPIDIKNDPFQRDIKKVAASLSGVTAQMTGFEAFVAVMGSPAPLLPADPSWFIAATDPEPDDLDYFEPEYDEDED